MGRGGDDIVLLPIVEIPRFAVAADALVLRSVANDAVCIAARATAHDEDLLRPVELVDGLADEEGVHGVDEFDLVHAAKVEEQAAFEVGADVSGVVEGVAVHEDVVGRGEPFHRFEDDGSEYPAEIGGFLKCIILTTCFAD